jgi:hypothetical protein
MLEPDPRSLKIPAPMASLTRLRASSRYGTNVIKHAVELVKLTSIFGFQPLSKTAIAAKLPEPIVTYGSLSVEP